MQLAVVIAAHNEEQHLPAQLDALRSQHHDGAWEVIVVDNRSTDRTAEVVAERSATWPRLRLLAAPDRGDKSYALNVAVASSDADAFLFTDADDVVSPGWVAAGASALADADLITGPLDLDTLNPPWLAASRGRSSEQPMASFEGIFPFVRGTNFGMTRRALDRLGPFPEAMYPVDDIELSLRAWRSGIDVQGVDALLVRYRYRPDATSLWRQGLAYGRGRCRVVRDLVDAGDPRPPRFTGWRSWAWLVLRLPTIVRPSGRAAWLWVLANRLGQVRGSVEQRLVYV
ncbi:MAG: glycosyltransferase [Actinomycetota bacterium]